MRKEIPFNLSLKTMTVGQLVSLPVFLDLIGVARNDEENAMLIEATEWITGLSAFEQQGVEAELIIEKAQQMFKNASVEFGQIMANPTFIDKFACVAISDADVQDNLDLIAYNEKAIKGNDARLKKLKAIKRKNTFVVNEIKRQKRTDAEIEADELKKENVRLLNEIKAAKERNKLQRGQMFYVNEQPLKHPLAFWLQYFQNTEKHIEAIPKEQYWQYWNYITPIVAMMAWRKDELTIIERDENGPRRINTGRIKYFSQVFLKMNAHVACNLFAFFLKIRMPNLPNQLLEFYQSSMEKQQAQKEVSTGKIGDGTP